MRSLYWNDVVRAATLSPSIRVREFSSSSASPSEKYSSAGLPLMLAKGRTAIEASVGIAGALGAAGVATVEVSIACW